ncbi:acyltransferase family protein [Prevotella sp. tf2-5]|uniref:acyltransferase family protein n=1 Tax=Prevotella sp. tf2-5 TaxID=1761889 RepID=UPI0008E42F50|nr:acyltransferase family protein [Prevotella sp. tf2-5]SFP02405.1 Fucose 4-O-acetylase [Prevotella sp. tf2-5]
MSKVRIKSIDFLKGITIILVVWGHAIQTINPLPGDNTIFNLIYSFHIPLFMFLSGFVSYKLRNTLDDIKKRAYQLLMPFFVYPLIAGILLHGNFSILRWVEIIETPDSGLWFLYVLFYITSFFIIINVINSKSGGGKKRLHILYIIGSIAVFIMFSAIAIYLRKVTGGRVDYGTSLFARHTIYFLLGMMSRAYIDKIKNLLLRTWYIYIPFWFVLALFWRMGNSPSFINNPNIAINMLYYYVTGVMGIVMMFSICLRFVTQESNNIMVGVVTYIGTITLGIYAIYISIVMRVVCEYFESWNINYSLTVLLSFICSMLICVLLIKIIEKLNVLPQLLLGKVRYK